MIVDKRITKMKSFIDFFNVFDLVTLDYETRYGTQYTLQKMNTSEYIRDQRFKAFMVGVKFNDEPAVIIPHKEIPKYLKKFKWKNTAMLAHNTAFDGMICSHHYGVVPAFYFDTLSMARALFSNQIRSNLDTLASFLGLGNKMQDVVNQWKDLDEIPEKIFVLGAAYCKVDVELCYKIFRKLIDPKGEYRFPWIEARLINSTLDMFCNPTLLLNDKLAKEAHTEEVERRKRLFHSAMGGKSVDTIIEELNAKHLHNRPKVSAEATKWRAMSNEDRYTEACRKLISNDNWLADQIEALGCEVPLKWSEKQEKWVFAFAKGDEEFTTLPDSAPEESRDDMESLVEARLAAKSTITLTRAQRLLNASQNGKYKVPAGYNYCAAHTMRWGGANKLNFQNFVRKSKLRRSIKAKSDEVLVVVDASQIEARFTAWVAQETWKLEAFRAYDVLERDRSGKPKRNKDGEKIHKGPDIYRLAYCQSFGAPDPWGITHEERQIGKVQELALGFGGAVNALRNMAKMVSRGALNFTDAEARTIVNKWRRACPNTVRFWAIMEEVLTGMMLRKSGTFGPGGIFEYGYDKRRDLGFIRMPNGLMLKYPELRADFNGKRFTNFRYYSARDGGVYLYGGKATENIVQCGARIAYSEALVRIEDHGVNIRMLTHDEAVAQDKRVYASKVYDIMDAEFSRSPAWAPDLPLAADGGWDNCYSK